jgi:hypothetical protein
MSTLQSVAVYRIDDHSQETAELFGDGFQFSVQRISQQIIVNIPEEMNNALLLRAW